MIIAICFTASFKIHIYRTFLSVVEFTVNRPL